MGKVVRVLPGMQAAFVEIGLERAAFLYAGDIFPEFLEQNDSSVNIEDPDSTVLETSPTANPRRGTPPIEDLIEEGQEIIVQVSKDPISTKGARIKTHITLPGRFMVCMPTVDHVGISRRIDKDKERRKLRKFVNSKRPEGCGFIVRTVLQDSRLKYCNRTWII